MIASAACDGEEVAGELAELLGLEVPPPVEEDGLVSPWLADDGLVLGETLAVGLLDVQVNAHSSTNTARAAARAARVMLGEL